MLFVVQLHRVLEKTTKCVRTSVFATVVAMCGIAGCLDFSQTLSREDLWQIARQMNVAMRHRGPDDGDIWHEESTPLIMAHRRLAIIDVSDKGHQPMHSRCGRFVIAFNGEIYNFKQLRQELQNAGYTLPFHSHCDTEIALACCQHWGIDTAISKFIGMFAFALWDRANHDLYLVRDRMGIKPLYYGWVAGSLVFASQISAFLCHPHFARQVDREALALYFRYNYIPAPFSIFTGVRKMLPGSLLKVCGNDRKSLIVKRYWSMQDVVQKSLAAPQKLSPGNILQQLEEILRESIRLRMQADVPLGAFLSGGIDSSLIVALMQQHSLRPIETFSIGFRETGYDEAQHARAVAKYLGTNHRELYLEPQHVLTTIAGIPQYYDEPFADSSQIPTMLVAQFARKYTKVILSGDGGDELFCGYDRYRWAQNIWRQMRPIPSWCRKKMAQILHVLPASVLDHALFCFAPLANGYGRSNPLSHKLKKLADFLPVQGPFALYSRMLTTAPLEPILEDEIVVDCPPELWSKLSFWQQMGYCDLTMYLPDDILTKLDRATMASSLEARVPMLDHRLVEFSWHIPLQMKMHQGKGKWPLRQLLDKYLPAKLSNRPKMGFAVPIGQWLRGPLRDWAEHLLTKRELAEADLPASVVRSRWQEHLHGKRDWQASLWNVLVYIMWRQKYLQ